MGFGLTSDWTSVVLQFPSVSLSVNRFRGGHHRNVDDDDDDDDDYDHDYDDDDDAGRRGSGVVVPLLVAFVGVHGVVGVVSAEIGCCWLLSCRRNMLRP